MHIVFSMCVRTLMLGLVLTKDLHILFKLHAIPPALQIASTNTKVMPGIVCHKLNITNNHISIYYYEFHLIIPLRELSQTRPIIVIDYI